MVKEEKKVNRRDYLKYTGAAIGGLVIGGALGYVLKPSEVVEKTIEKPVTTTIGAATVTKTETVEKTVTATGVAPPTKVKITAAIMSAHGMSDSAEDAAKRFMKLHPEIEVEVIPIGFDILLDKLLTDYSTHAATYDIASIAYHWIGTVGIYLADLDEIRKAYPEIVNPLYDWEDVPEILRNTYCFWKGKNIGLPFVDGCLTLFYRTDLFENPEYKAKFKELYGYELKMPTDKELFELNWKMLRDYAEFFTNKVKWREGEQYGVSIPAKVGDPLLSTYCCYFGYYRRSPEGLKTFGPVDPDWGDYFTSDHKPAFDPRISDLGEKALNEYIEMTKFAPSAVDLDWVTSCDPFRAGTTAMFFGWGGYWPYLTGADSPIRGKVAVCMLPAPHLGGWNVAINNDSKHKKEAYMLIEFMTNKENCKYLYETLTETPYRWSTFEDPVLKEKHPDHWVLGASFKTGKVTTRPKIPVLPKLEYSMGATLSPAFVGQATPKDALIACADEWIRIIKEAGLS
jgi:ABC-type glycerol-3-phosphate transport system substrate-binding protein